MFIFLKAAHSMEENDFAKLCLKKLIALQSAYSSPAESGIMEDLGLSIAAVSINISFIFCNINKWYMYIYIYIHTYKQEKFPVVWYFVHAIIFNTFLFD